MVGHQHIGVQRHLELGCGLLQPAQPGAVIGFFTENGLPVVAGLHYVVHLKRHHQAG